jgi:hypothetical protein
MRAVGYASAVILTAAANPPYELFFPQLIVPWRLAREIIAVRWLLDH